jgi:hypothetical protein
MLKVALRHFLKPSFLLLESVMARPAASRGPRRPRPTLGGVPSPAGGALSRQTRARCERSAPAAGGGPGVHECARRTAGSASHSDCPTPVQVADRTRGESLPQARRSRARVDAAGGGGKPCSPSLLPGSHCRQRDASALFFTPALPSPLWRLVGFGDPRE